jgi:hypothetical protein
MKTFNRIVTVLLLLALIPIVTVGLIAPREGVQLLSETLDKINAQLDPSPPALQMLLRAVVALLIDGFLVILLYLEVRRSAESGVRVQQVTGGEAQIAVDSIVSRLGYQIDRLPGVLEVTPTVIPRRGGVEVVLDIEMTADGNITANIEEISAVTRRVIEDDMGLKLKGKPKLNLHTVEYPGAPPIAQVRVPALAELGGGTGEEKPAHPADEESVLAEPGDEPEAGKPDESGNLDIPS